MNCLLSETKPQLNSTTTTTATKSLSSATLTSASSSSAASSSSLASSNTTTSNSIPANKTNNLSSHHQTTIGTGHTSLNSQETCLICGDVASGKHYGLRSCEACKAFFKRTVQGKIEYSCPATKECEINKRRRKACQACRFQKCLNMGMLKEGVRLDRVRGGRQKYRRGLSPVSLGGGGGGGGGGIDNFSNANNNNSNGNPNTASQNNLTSAQIDGNHKPNFSIPLVSGNGIGASIGVSSISSDLIGASSETNRIMTALINCEPEELPASQAQFVANIPSTLSVQMKTLYILSDLFDRELVSLIGWAKQIPRFSETITLNDQMRLLQSTWAEVIALSIGYRSHLKRLENHKQLHGNGIHLSLNATPSPTSSSPASAASGYSYNNNNDINHQLYNNLDSTEIRLVFAKDLIIDFKHAVTCGAEEIFYNCVQLIKRLDQLRITPKEYILLKAISLTNADVRLENPKATHQLRDLVMDTLYEATLNDCLMNCNDIAASTLAAATISSQSSSTHPLNQHKQQDGNHNVSSLTTGNIHQIKIEVQDRPLSSMNQYASTTPPRPSSSLPSSSMSSISPHNNSSSNSSNLNVNNLDLANKRTIVNNRLNQVLLCLPVLRQIDSCIRKFWNDVRKGPNNVPMNKLFEEMLEPCQRNFRSSAEM